MKTTLLLSILALAMSVSSVRASATAPTVVHSFDGYSEGAYPRTPLVLASDGSFYGAAGSGGSATGTLGKGTVFKVTTSGALTTLHAFTGGSDGATPQSAPTLGSDGNLYGTTSHGGTTSGDSGAGTVYMATTSGAVTTLYSFTGGSDGAAPLGALVLASDGNLYGTTSGSTDGSNHGTLFRVSTAGALTTLHAFAGTADGDGPAAALVQAGDGSLYGTTHAAGTNSDGTLADGTLFSVSMDGTFSTVSTFSGGGTSLGAANPFAALTAGSDGNLYGTTVNGGANSSGTFIKAAVSGGHPGFFSGEVSLGNSIYYLAFSTGNYFGYYAYLSDSHYLYHFDMGFEYWFDAADGNSGIYFYDFASKGFFDTNPSYPFPYLYDFSLNSVVYYYPDASSAGHYTSSPRYFYDFATGAIISK